MLTIIPLSRNRKVNPLEKGAGLSADRDDQKKRIGVMGNFLLRQPTDITNYDHTPLGVCDTIVRWLIEKFTVSKGH